MQASPAEPPPEHRHRGSRVRGLRNLLRTFGLDSPATRLIDAVRSSSLIVWPPYTPRRSSRALECTNDFDALLARPDLDAVIVATPPSRHHAMALAALRAGKHVWVEKPLALGAAEGRELVEAAATASRILFVDETFLYDPLVREMKRIVDGGGLGEVLHLSFERLGMGRIRRDSSVWWNSAPHDLSILFHLLPRAVTAVRLHEHAYLQPGIADMAVCDLELEGGASAHVYLSWLHPEKTATVTVVGRERMLAYEGRFEKRRPHAVRLHARSLDAGRHRRRAHRADLPDSPGGRFEVPAGEGAAGRSPRRTSSTASAPVRSP